MRFFFSLLKPHRSHQTGRLTEKHEQLRRRDSVLLPLYTCDCRVKYRKRKKVDTRRRGERVDRKEGFLMDRRDTSPPGRKRSKKRDGCATTPGGERRRFHLVGYLARLFFNLVEINEREDSGASMYTATHMRKFRLLLENGIFLVNCKFFFLSQKTFSSWLCHLDRSQPILMAC